MSNLMKESPTPAELKLKNVLNSRLSSYKFTSQINLYGFIVDFYCSDKKLVVEVDGEVHNNRKEYDAKRDKFLLARGIRTLRFSNNLVLNDINFVIKQIKSNLD